MQLTANDRSNINFQVKVPQLNLCESAEFFSFRISCKKIDVAKEIYKANTIMQ